MQTVLAELVGAWLTDVYLIKCGFAHTKSTKLVLGQQISGFARYNSLPTLCQFNTVLG